MPGCARARRAAHEGRRPVARAPWREASAPTGRSAPGRRRRWLSPRAAGARRGSRIGVVGQGSCRGRAAMPAPRLKQAGAALLPCAGHGAAANRARGPCPHPPARLRRPAGLLRRDVSRERAGDAVRHRRDFVQDNHSRSVRGVVRGMHFQPDPPAAKLVRCARGAIVDVLVDIRPGSASFGALGGLRAR